MGSASTKKEAKRIAAMGALASFLQFPNQTDAQAALSWNDLATDDFTHDPLGGELIYSSDSAAVPLVTHSASPAVAAGVPKLLPADKNPVMVLNEIHPGIKFAIVSETGASHAKNFELSVEVDGRIFTGSGRNKKQAKARAAQTALAEVYGIQFITTPGESYLFKFEFVSKLASIVICVG